jgi:hypothetical protein
MPISIIKAAKAIYCRPEGGTGVALRMMKDQQMIATAAICKTIFSQKPAALAPPNSRQKTRKAGTIAWRK